MVHRECLEKKVFHIYNIIMLLFHGSNLIVKNPSLKLSRKSLDFGPGFYTTENKKQAIDFSYKVAVRKKQENQIVSIYNYDEQAAQCVLNILKFHIPDKSWLDYVHQNRNGLYSGTQYDIVTGPVANDDVYATLLIYEQGILSIEQTLETLKIKKMYNQFVFKTDKALSFLKFSNYLDLRELP